MIKADTYSIDNLTSIVYGDGTWDENPRPKYADGQPGHSKFITQIFEEYDLSNGEFPITTLRNTAIKTGIKEILWIYQKQTNSLVVAREMGIIGALRGPSAWTQKTPPEQMQYSDAKAECAAFAARDFDKLTMVNYFAR